MFCDSAADFQKAFNDRKGFVAKERRVEIKKVLSAFCIDLSVLGGVTDEALKLCDLALKLLQTRDILMVICHGAPQAASAGESGSADGSGSASGSGVAHPGLPVAPSNIGVASNKAAVRAQLVAEFDRIMEKLKGARQGNSLDVSLLRGRGEHWSPEEIFSRL